MDILTDWKYQIVFNNDKYIDVKNYTLLLNPKEKIHMDKQVEFYRKHFSFDQVITKLSTLSEHKQGVLLNFAMRNKQYIAYTPSCLKQYYLYVIKDKFPEYANILTQLLSYSQKQKNSKNPIKYLYKDILGSYYGLVKRKVQSYANRKLVYEPFNKPLHEFDYLREVRLMEKQMYEDKISQGIFGKFTLFDTKFNYNNHIGMGDYRSKKVHHVSNDLFVINTRHTSISLEQLHHQIYYNLYPGYGHLINNIVNKTHDNCVDVGATYLINGWKTFVTWHYNPTLHTRNIKTIYSTIVNACFGSHWGKSIDKTYLYLLSIMDKKQAMSYIRDLTQYPGLLESHVFGALATEQLINRKFASSPENLLKVYKTINLGDFFWEYTKRNYKNIKIKD